MTTRNPATALLRMFEQWDTDAMASTGGMRLARGWDEDDETATSDHILAWTYLGEVSRTIVGLQDLGLDLTASLEYLPTWGQMAAGVDVAWNSTTGREEAFPPDAMAQLRMLATLIEMAGGRGTPANLDLLGEVVREAMGLLAEDDTISDELRSYLVKLVREVRDALEDERIGGGFNFPDAAERLWVAMNAASAQSEKESSAWKSAAAKLLPPAVGGVLTHMGTVGFDAVMGMLGS